VRDSGDSLIAFAQKDLDSGDTILTPVEAHWLFGLPLLGASPVDLLVDTLESISFEDINFPGHLMNCGLYYH
jgi:hypothetical protein